MVASTDISVHVTHSRPGLLSDRTTRVTCIDWRTSVIYALYRGVDERCCSPIGIEVNYVDPIALHSMVIHQRATHSESIATLQKHL